MGVIRQATATLALVLLTTQLGKAQEPSGRTSHEIVLKQVALGLYFLFDFDSSNAAFLVTEEGVVVVDTRQHPRDGQDLLDRIRKITDKPIKWVINTHFHGDHNYGNSVFKATGATIISQDDTGRLMKQVAEKEFTRRQTFFRARGYDPKEVKLVLPDVTFDHEASIRLGGKEIRLMYFGAGQNPGDTFVLFPHDRMIYTPGAFARHSIPNMTFTSSVESWINLLNRVAAMDVDKILPPHGDLADRADVKELANFLADEYATVKDAIARRTPLDIALKTLTLEKYKDWRNYRRREQEIKALYELIQTGKRSYFDNP
jgi:cyclase